MFAFLRAFMLIWVTSVDGADPYCTNGQLEGWNPNGEEYATCFPMDCTQLGGGGCDSAGSCCCHTYFSVGGNNNCGVNRWCDTHNAPCSMLKPTPEPTPKPTQNPTLKPTSNPTPKPTQSPTFEPSKTPTVGPTSYPTKSPTFVPTLPPSFRPTESQLNIAIIPTDSPVTDVIDGTTQVLDQTTEFAREQEDSMEIMKLSDELIGGLSLGFLCVTCFCVIVVWLKWYRKKKAAVVKMVEITHGDVGSSETYGKTQDGENQTTGNTNSDRVATTRTNSRGQTTNQLKVQSNEPNMNANVLPPLPIQAEVEHSSTIGSDLYDHDNTMQTVGATNQTPAGANNIGICADCGLDKPGEVCDENGLFYCADCQSYYTQY